MPPEKRRELTIQFLKERTLDRAEFIRALSSLEPGIALIASEPPFHEYVTAIGAADRVVLDALYVGPESAVELTTMSGAELLEIARRTTAAYLAATDAATKELGTSGASEARSADAIRADLLRLIAARRYGWTFSETPRSAAQPYDALLDFDAATRGDPGIAAAAKKAGADPAMRDSLDAAIASFRRAGEALGRGVVEGAGWAAVCPRILWEGQESTPALETLQKESRGDPQAWRETNEALVDAIERFLLVGGDARAAARWRLRALAAMAGREIVVQSWGRQVAEIATLFGVSAEELAAVRAVLEEGVVVQVERMKATLTAHDRWARELARDGVRVHGALPSDALLSAHERQMATEAQLRQRVLDAIQSPLLREELGRIRPPDESEFAPRWIQAVRERERATMEEQPGDGGAR